MVYPVIADHGLIGDLQSPALVAADGTIDSFFCPDSGALGDWGVGHEGWTDIVSTHVALIAAVLNLDNQLGHPKGPATELAGPLARRG